MSDTTLEEILASHGDVIETAQAQINERKMLIAPYVEEYLALTKMLAAMPPEDDE